MGDERLGRYTVLKHLASGGMADVLLGRADGIEGFERHVVLKRIRSEHAKDQRFITMFLDEARVAASLHHQNIVQVYDIGETSGEYFFAMEYIHGEDLRRLLSAVSKTRAHMPLGYVVTIVTAVAAGLHYAHERRDSKGKPLNIVHRDVSPSNVLIGYDGSVKIVDFGIAKAAMRQVETRSGSLKGKVSYMSPEQCKGEDIDRRSDVWALGVLLYELATTTRLFKGDNDYLQMDAIVNGKIPLPRVRRADLPNELCSIIMRALSVDIERRYHTADELRIALERFAAKEGITASTSSLAGYMHELFGERPEPWLDDAESTSVDHGPVDVEAPTATARHSWTEFPREDSGGGSSRSSAKPRTDGKRRRSGIANAVALSDTIAPPISTKETRTSMKMGWEAQGNKPDVPARRGKLVWLAVPVIALVGVGVWQLALKGDRRAPAPSAAVQPTPAAAPPTEPAPAAAPAAEPTPAAREVPAVRVAGFIEPETPPAAEAEPAPPPAEVTVEKKAPKPSPVKRPEPKHEPKKEPKKEPEKVATPAPAAVAAPAPAPPPPPPQPTVTKPVPTPAVVEPQMAVLSNATVSNVASRHTRQLAACEGTEALQGEVVVRFEIDGTGKVVKSQLSSTIKNPKVAGCILRAVQSWQFPRPSTGAAKGVYSISYQ